jgi:hypothetical protein
MIKEIEGQEFLRKTLQIFWAKTILDYKKFLKFREVRLKEIHRNVAVLTIKKYFSSNCITFSVFMRKVKKFKRMIKMCKSGSVQSKGDMYSTKDQSTVRSDVFDAGSNGELRADDLGNIMECASLTSTEYVELEKARREKIQNGLICYNIQRNKEPLPVLPYLYQKDILEEHSPPSHYTVLTSCLVSRMTTANPQRQNPKRHLISPKALISERFELPVLPQTPKKIIFTNENLPNFTRPTQSSLASRSKDETFMSETPKSVGNYREHSTLFNQTFSGMQKLMDIKRQSISSHKRKEFREGRLSLPVDWLGSKGNVFRARTTLENFRK